MQFFTILIIVAILWWVIRPAFKVWRAVHRVKQGDFSAFSDLFGNPGAQKSRRRPDGSRRPGWSPSPPRKKKIPSDVGEYVHFTEVASSTTASSATDGQSQSVHYEHEEQITDAEWQDI